MPNLSSQSRSCKGFRNTKEAIRHQIWAFYTTSDFSKLFGANQISGLWILNVIELNSFSSHSVFIVFFLLRLLCLWKVLWHLFSVRASNTDNNTQKHTKGHATNAKLTWCVLVCVSVCVYTFFFREILKVLANFQLAASVISPCLSVFPQLCYISLPLSFCTIVSVSASVSHACPPSAPTLFSHISQCEKSPRVFLLGFLRTGSPYLMKWLSC